MPSWALSLINRGLYCGGWFLAKPSTTLITACLVVSMAFIRLTHTFPTDFNYFRVSLRDF